MASLTATITLEVKGDSNFIHLLKDLIEEKQSISDLVNDRSMWDYDPETSFVKVEVLG